MKKNLSGIPVLIVILLLLVALTGCDSVTDDTNEMPDNEADELPVDVPVQNIVFRPDIVYVPEFTSLSALYGELPNINNVIATENALYLTSTNEKRNDQFFQTTNIFTVDHAEGVLTYLPDYAAAQPPAGAEGGSMLIGAMQVDPEGCIWVIEANTYVTFDFPSGFDIDEADINEILEYQKPMMPSFFIRKLDKTGAELLSVNITQTMLTTQDSPGIFALYVDDEENIFIGTGRLIFVFDTEGNIRFTFGTESLIDFNSLIKLSDGQIAFNSRNNDPAVWTLQVIDIFNGEWGTVIDLPQNTQDVFHGFGEYLVITNNGMSLTGIDKRTYEEIVLFNWIDSGIWPTGLANVLLLPDYHIMFTTTVWDYDTSGVSSHYKELVVINRQLRNELPEITVLTIASFMPYLIDPAVAEFNRTNYTYRVEIIEPDLNTWKNSIDDLHSEILAGSGPDMIHLYRMPPLHQWIDQGLFEDLYELIDADPVLDRSDFMGSVLKCFEYDRKLYQMAPGFNISTLIGFPDVTGSERGWGIEEFRDVINENPQARLPMGPSFNGFQILNMIISNNMEYFIDWDSGEVYFDSDYFIDLLEFAYTIESNIDRNSISIIDNIPYQRISSGEQIIELVSFNRFEEYSAFQDLFGGDFIFKGFPVENGSGNYLYSDYSLAVTAESENKDGVREFLRLFLSEGWQRQTLNNVDYMTHYIPTNRKVFEEKINEARAGFRFPQVIYGDLSTRSRPLTQEQTDNIRALIDSVSSAPLPLDDFLVNIYMEIMTEFLSDSITAQDAAGIMQEKALAYISE